MDLTGHTHTPARAPTNTLHKCAIKAPTAAVSLHTHGCISGEGKGVLPHPACSRLLLVRAARRGLPAAGLLGPWCKSCALQLLTSKVIPRPCTAAAHLKGHPKALHCSCSPQRSSQGLAVQLLTSKVIPRLLRGSRVHTSSPSGAVASVGGGGAATGSSTSGLGEGEGDGGGWGAGDGGGVGGGEIGDGGEGGGEGGEMGLGGEGGGATAACQGGRGQRSIIKNRLIMYAIIRSRVIQRSRVGGGRMSFP